MVIVELIGPNQEHEIRVTLRNKAAASSAKLNLVTCEVVLRFRFANFQSSSSSHLTVRYFMMSIPGVTGC